MSLDSHKILVLGGDGFVGWPTALHLSSQGAEVAIVDNFSRRKIDIELQHRAVFNIATLSERVNRWHQVTGTKINYFVCNIAEEYETFVQIVADFRPTVICHFAEQRSAPFSMLNSSSKRYTVDNNVRGTHNVLVAIADHCPQCHLVHMGTMGVYGYGATGAMIPEGYIDVNIGGATQKIVHPYQPGSVYHTTKCLDNVLFHFYAKNNNVIITDLHQGIIWGSETKETSRHIDLRNRCDIDGEYGTVLNRFAAQCILDEPLSVYGTGGQTRAFIHIEDSVRCTATAIASPPLAGDPVRMFNQVTECRTINDIAQMFVAVHPKTRISNVANPRKEAPSNELIVRGTQEHPGKFSELGLKDKIMITPEYLKQLIMKIGEGVGLSRDTAKKQFTSKARW